MADINYGLTTHGPTNHGDEYNDAEAAFNYAEEQRRNYGGSHTVYMLAAIFRILVAIYKKMK